MNSKRHSYHLGNSKGFMSSVPEWTMVQKQNVCIFYDSTEDILNIMCSRTQKTLEMMLSPTRGSSSFLY